MSLVVHLSPVENLRRAKGDKQELWNALMLILRWLGLTLAGS